MLPVSAYWLVISLCLLCFLSSSLHLPLSSEMFWYVYVCWTTWIRRCMCMQERRQATHMHTLLWLTIEICRKPNLWIAGPSRPQGLWAWKEMLQAEWQGEHVHEATSRNYSELHISILGLTSDSQLSFWSCPVIPVLKNIFVNRNLASDSQLWNHSCLTTVTRAATSSANFIFLQVADPDNRFVCEESIRTSQEQCACIAGADQAGSGRRENNRQDVQTVKGIQNCGDGGLRAERQKKASIMLSNFIPPEDFLAF